MTIEITILLLALLLLFVQTLAEGLMTALNYGVKTASSGRDEVPLIQPGKRGRLYRAINNYKENLFYFIPLILLSAILGISNIYTIIGAKLFLGARIVYVPVYVMGTPYIRSVIFVAGIFGLITLAYGLFI